MTAWAIVGVLWILVMLFALYVLVCQLLVEVVTRGGGEHVCRVLAEAASRGC